MMFKILFSIMLFVSLASSAEMGKSGGGCTLAQQGEFKVGYNDVTLKDVKYIAKAPSGKNFREIFVGSKVVIAAENPDNIIKAEILDYKPNKRMKGKPKTGLFIVEINTDDFKAVVPMKYVFDAGVMKANAEIHAPYSKKESSLKIWFQTDVKYSLCYSK